ncbi:hypothetical protein D3C86_1491900 [compost metagenome]
MKYSSSSRPTSSSASRRVNMHAPEMASTSIGAGGNGCLCRWKSVKSFGQRLASRARPNARTKERHGVGTARRPPACSVPSGLSSRPPTMPARGLASHTACRRASAPGCSSQSGFRKSRYLHLAEWAPRLHALAKPWLSGLRRMTRLSRPAQRCSRMARLSSADALSTTMISCTSSIADKTQAANPGPAL